MNEMSFEWLEVETQSPASISSSGSETHPPRTERDLFHAVSHEAKQRDVCSLPFSLSYNRPGFYHGMRLLVPALERISVFGQHKGLTS